MLIVVKMWGHQPRSCFPLTESKPQKLTQGKLLNTDIVLQIAI